MKRWCGDCGFDFDKAREIALEGLAFHQPEWASPQAKAAGKEPWVCNICGVADGHWPCDAHDAFTALLALIEGDDD